MRGQKCPAYTEALTSLAKYWCLGPSPSSNIRGQERHLGRKSVMAWAEAFCSVHCQSLGSDTEFSGLPISFISHLDFYSLSWSSNKLRLIFSSFSLKFLAVRNELTLYNKKESFIKKIAENIKAHSGKFVLLMQNFFFFFLFCCKALSRICHLNLENDKNTNSLLSQTCDFCLWAQNFFVLKRRFA